MSFRCMMRVLYPKFHSFHSFVYQTQLDNHLNLSSDPTHPQPTAPTDPATQLPYPPQNVAYTPPYVVPVPDPAAPPPVAMEPQQKVVKSINTKFCIFIEGPTHYKHCFLSGFLHFSLNIIFYLTVHYYHDKNICIITIHCFILSHYLHTLLICVLLKNGIKLK